MSDVFVSYKAEDRKRVQPLVQALQADGLSVWWDEHIGAGDAWRETIERQLGEARSVIVIWSKRSVGPEGGFVREEASRAQRRGVYVPVLIDPVMPPLGFGESQATSLKAWHGDRSDPHYLAVLSAVHRICGIESDASPQDKSRTRLLTRRTAIVGGAAATMAAAGIGGWALFRNGMGGADSHSIAVLPFENLSGDPAQAYFSNGIAEEIRSALSRIAGLKVAGSTSSEAVRNDDATTAAKRLAVSNILTGSVRQSASIIRITAELIDGRTGLDKWSQSYDRSPGDAIKIQTDIAENVATALSATLGQAARAAIQVGGTTNAAAHDLYLKARAQIRADDSEDSFRKALGLLESAITLDPKFADAYALKAETLANLTGFYIKPGDEYGPAFDRAAGVARQAVSLAPELASAHLALAYILLSQLNVGAAAPEYARGHSLAGGDVKDLLAYAQFLAIINDTGAGLQVARQAQARDPLNSVAFSTEAGFQVRAGNLAEAERGYRKAIALSPGRQIARTHLGDTLMLAGKYDEALAQYKSLPADYLFRLTGESMLSFRKGDRAASDAAFKRAQQIYGDSANFQYAEVHAQRGEKDLAFASLDRAWTFRDPGLAYMKQDWSLDPISSDPRYAALLRKMNFPA